MNDPYPIESISIQPIGVTISARSSTSPTRQDEWTSQIRLGPLARCTHAPSQVWFIVDGSGSLTAHGGNDPLGRRFDEVALALDQLPKCRCGNEVAGIVHFDPGPSDRGPVPLAKGRRRANELTEGLVVPAGGTGSRLQPALSRVHAHIAADPSKDPVIVVLSDFELFDSNVDAVMTSLAGTGRAHAIVLNNRIPDIVHRTDGLEVAAVRYDDPPGVVARAVADALCANRASRSHKPSAGDKAFADTPGPRRSPLWRWGGR